MTNLSVEPPAPLVTGYSTRFRAIEISAIGLFAVLFAALAARTYGTGLSLSAPRIGVLWLAGALAADFVAGLVHWSADTWGNQGWLIVGPTLIRSFREHHLDQHAITHHNFVETNGANALVLLPAMIAAHLLLPRDASAWTRVELQGTVFALALFFFVFMTNQIHKWAHVDRAPRVVRYLQNLKLIMSAEHHRGHHASPHTIRYCITTGWLNPVLDRIGFFRMSERFIQTVSKLEPREDDLRLIGMAARSSVRPDPLYQVGRSAPAWRGDRPRHIEKPQ